jgi:hypothetical protein
MDIFSHRFRSLLTRSASAFWAASFLFFLLYSAPHRVHHFFEQFPQAAHHHDSDHEHPNNGGGHGSPNAPKCVFQNVGKPLPWGPG